VRLVVDTGSHDMGWSRDQVVDSMRKSHAVDEPTIQPRPTATSPGRRRRAATTRTGEDPRVARAGDAAARRGVRHPPLS
jgi:hypothetical protein